MDAVATLLAAFGVLPFIGLTFIAYRHPEAFAKMFPFLAATCFAVLTFTFGWVVGSTDTADDVRRFIDLEDSITAFEATRARSKIFLGAGFATIVAFVYLTFLSALPLLLNKDSGNA